MTQPTETRPGERNLLVSLRYCGREYHGFQVQQNAQKARGADLESGTMIQRAKALVPILIPLFVSAFRRADELALAMECRCYRGGEGRTRMKQLHTAPWDWMALGIMVLCTIGILAINILL